MNNKEQICLKIINLAIRALSGRILTKRDNSAFCMQWCTLNAIESKEFRWTGKQYNMWTNGVFFNKTFHSYKPLSSSLLSSTYHLIFSQTVKWDSRVLLCWSLRQNYLWAGHLIILRWNGNSPFIGKLNCVVQSKEAIAPSKQIKTNLKF